MNTGLDGVTASARFLCVQHESELSVEIGVPRRIDESEAACPVAIRGACSIFQKATDIFGADTLQALCLALRFARMRLRDFESKGCAFVYPDTREAVAIDLVFGRATDVESSS